jgi:putative flippase GtrA
VTAGPRLLGRHGGGGRYRAGRRAIAVSAGFAATSRFAAVGMLGAVVDFGGFNLLHFQAGVGPLTAKTAAVALATLVTYAGNRFWAFPDRCSAGHRRDLPVFAALNGVGLLIALGVLAAVRYGLGLTSPLALNVLGNGGGIALGMVFRYWAYRTWVFRAPPATAVPATAVPATLPPPATRRATGPAVLRR